MITPIKSQRSFVNFYLKLFGFCFFYSLLGFATLGLFIHLFNSNEFETRNYGLILLFGGVCAAAIYTIYKFIKNAPSIEINEESIKLNSTTYLWENLEKIELTGKKHYLFFDDKESVSLKFKNQKERYFLDDFYNNTPQIKRFISQYITKDEDNISPQLVTPKSFDESLKEIIYYKGNPFLSLQWVSLFTFTLILLFGCIASLIEGANLTFFLAGAFCIIFFLLLSYRTYFFALSDDYLIIRNINFFWIKKTYLIADIKEVVLEQQSRMPTNLRVITTDFENKSYYACTLWDKHWRRLKSGLEERNVKVRLETSIDSFV